jgi:hypothetical protein
MKLYIKVENGQPIDHPAVEENLLQAFPDGIPFNWEPFNRIPFPTLKWYESFANPHVVYEKINGVWTDVFQVIQLTAEERAAKQQSVITEFNSREQASNWSAWTFDEATCAMVPPVSRPEPDQTKLEQKIFTFWCGADSNWKDTPAMPDGKYKFDFFAWQWVEITE